MYTAEFVCSCCNCVDLKDVTHPEGLPTDPKLQLCYKCKNGEWHHLFAKVPYDPNHHSVSNRPNSLG